MLKIESHIAWRYLVAKKRQNAINIISGISCLAVAVVTAAMICVLSVMNGFGEAVEQMFSQLDAELRITPAQGKSLSLDDERIQSLYAIPEVEIIAPTIEETALVEFRGRQVPAMLKGVDTTYQQLTAIDSIIIDGSYAVWDGAFERCVMGVGLANTIGIGAHFISPAHIYAPKRVGRVNMLRPDENFHTKGIFIAGVFAVNQTKYDDTYMLISCRWRSSCLSTASSRPPRSNCGCVKERRSGMCRKPSAPILARIIRCSTAMSSRRISTASR